ncbi:hypothetical protein EV702DRAFT_1041136 [Suillus placidus]|uniref:Uncharacterized protein n=1 Tax=Suillus placidus TaxID=48579 RepID=A0A9P7D7F2_9AGAM|nr:hypothetical protein EV702DRAFT_1041136 [Suillus placidus]
MGRPVSIGNNIPPGPSVIIEDIHNMGPWSGGPYNTEFVTEGAPRATQASHPGFHILQDNLANILASLLMSFSAIKSRVPGPGTWNSKWVSHRATQASHPGFHILQDNLRAVKDHVKRAPATLFSKIPTLVGHLTWTVLTELCVESRVPGPGTQNSELGTRNSALGTRSLATQASHPGFHILQHNPSAIKGHVKRSPAAPETQ